MNDQELFKILTILNSDFSDDITDNIVEIDGTRFYYTEYDNEDNKITASLCSDMLSFERVGYKEMSYERWINTNWLDWE